MVAEPDPVADVLPPGRQQVVRFEVGQHGAVDVGARDAWSQRVECDLLGGDGVVEHSSHLVTRSADDHAALELGVVPPDGSARLGDEEVTFLKLDVVGDGVRPGASEADLASIAGCGAVGRRLLAAVGGAELVDHREGRFVPCAQAGLRLGHARTGVLLQQPVGVLAPAGALADQLHLRLALAHHHALDQRRQRSHVGPHHLPERRAFVTENARIAVIVGSERAVDAHVSEDTAEDSHRMLCARVLGVGLHPTERRLGLHALDLELGNEDGEIS